MKKRNIKKITLQMWDIRPVDKDGKLDLETVYGRKKSRPVQRKKIESSALGDARKESPVPPRILRDISLDGEYFYLKQRKIKKSFQEIKDSRLYRMGSYSDSSEVPIIYVSDTKPSNFVLAEEIKKIAEPAPEKPKAVKKIAKVVVKKAENKKIAWKIVFEKPLIIYKKSELKFNDPDEFQFQKSSAAIRFIKKKRPRGKIISLNEILLARHFSPINLRRFVFSFNSIAIIIFVCVFGIGFIYKGIKIREAVLNNGAIAYASLDKAKNEVINKNFERSSFEFAEAYEKFGEISKDLNSLGKIFVGTSHFIPYLSKISSGDSLARAGQDISRVGILAGEVLKNLDGIKNPLNHSYDSISFLKIFQDSANNSKEIKALLEDAEKNLVRVNLDDVPEDKRDQIVDLKSKLVQTKKFIDGFLENSYIFADVLGGNGPRKYLFLFQNNQEMRATGGFVGSYGVLDISNGRIRNFFIDGIFNPDGQLREKVVPPAPIQKISAAWSLHDSNWFPDFPISAEKATWFYEKTGGPTVDGVITMTPTVMQKLLEITGPIEMPDYGVVIDSENFTEKIQYEVEVDYDKELNKPKQILADLAPIILDKIFNTKNFADIARTMSVLVDSLNEKHILIYSTNYEIEKKLSALGWSGEIINTDKDYISVINSNINGFKTDGIIEEKIEHLAEIQNDGSIVDTVTITRRHNGGDSNYEWWNKVNADYMRVYVPQGSKLLSAEGQTREFNSPPLDYNALNFKRDPQVQTEEDAITVDEETGTRIYDSEGKTVFANWVYVSPQETVVVKYQYLLPYKISMNESTKPADTYSLLAQKQSGSLGDKFISDITYPENYQMIWKYPDAAEIKGGRTIYFESDLKSDKFIGIAFTSSN
ncbi:MAG: hypothetical protein CO141_02080 [Candidatus Moranbacteria bacterium CG_4_9_14_3_um_filter_42_9]|nr:MAG: hypothetical protein CO141_02080 [Candidatus Moranbacteria bacterium CG_4_9_14_3_um_filter_42_9]